MTKIKVIHWYDTIVADQSKVSEAIIYWRTVIEDASQHIHAIGHLQTLVAETPGLQFFYNGIHVDAQQSRRWFEEYVERVKAEKYKWFLTSPEAQREYGTLKVTDVNNFVKADKDYARAVDKLRSLANIEHALETVRDGFISRSIMLNRLVDIRSANLQDVWIDPTRETNNG